MEFTAPVAAADGVDVDGPVEFFDRIKRGKKFAVRGVVNGAVADTPITGTVAIQVAKGSGAFRTVATRSLTGVSVKAMATAPKGTKVSFLRVRTVASGDAAYAGSTSSVAVVALR